MTSETNKHVVILFIENDNRASGWTIAAQTGDELIALIADEAIQNAEDGDDEGFEGEHLGVAVLTECEGRWQAVTTTPDGDRHTGMGADVDGAMHDLRCKVGARENWG